MNRLKLILLILLVPGSVFAQISEAFYNTLPDSLKPKNRQALTLREKSSILYKAHAVYTSTFANEMDRLANEAEKQSVQADNGAEKINSIIALSCYYYDPKQDYMKALKGFEQAYRLVPDLRELSNRQLQNLFQMAGLYSFFGHHDSAIRRYYEFLDVFKEKADTGGLRLAYSVVSYIHYKLKLHEKAIFYNQQFIQTFKPDEKWNINYTSAVISIISNYTYLKEKTGIDRYADSAYQFIELVKREKKSPQGMANWYGACYFYLSRLAFASKEYKKALAYCDTSMRPGYDTADYFFGGSNSKQFYYALYLIKYGRYSQGKQLLDKLKLDNSFDDLRTMNKVLYEHAIEKGDPANALTYYMQYQAFTDSLDVIKQQATIFEASQKYSVAEKQAQITALENANLLKEKKFATITAVGSSVALVLLTAFVIVLALYKRTQYRRQAEKQQLTAELFKAEADIIEKMAKQDVERERYISEQRKKISDDIHDEISSGLAALKFYIGDLKSIATGAEAKKTLADIEAEVQTLYIQTRNFMNGLRLNQQVNQYNVAELLKSLAEHFNGKNKLQVIPEIDEENIQKKFTVQQHYELYLIIKELVTNTIKHAGATKINCKIYFDSDTCHFTIADNGKGFNVNKVNKGLGLESIKKRLTSLGGIMQLLTDNDGTRVTSSFSVSGN